MDTAHIKPNRTIRTLLPMACDGVGPSFTCVSLMTGAHRAGYDVEIFANRSRQPRVEVPTRLAFPGPLGRLPYKYVSTVASRLTERAFLNSIKPEDIAYLWPAASLEVHRVLHERGIPVVLEGINTRMATAKKVLDQAYNEFGIPPAHGITEERIEEEESKYRYASTIFAPNRHVGEALKGSPLENRFISTSYGVDTSREMPKRIYEKKGALTYMFCGYACVRKGAHFLLDAWRLMPGPHKLQLVGRIEPAIARRYNDVLASDTVEVVGFVDNVHKWFAGADVFVFPTLEEGDPLVTYEAATHGLPIVSTSIGAGNIGSNAGTVRIHENIRDARLMRDELLEMIPAQVRKSLGEAARREAQNYDWLSVGAARARKVQALMREGV